MISEILANILFELKIRYRSLSSYVYYGMFFVLSLLMTLAAGGAFNGVVISFGTSSRVFVNAPLTITMYMALLSAFQLFIIAPVFGQAICKDFINNIDQIVFSSPLKVRNFLVGRYLGALIFMMILATSVPLGIFVAAQLPFVLPSMIGANSLAAYLAPLFTVALPNILMFGAIFFLIGARSKKMAPIYIGATLLFLMWSVSGQVLKDLDNRMLGSLIDPLGLRALSQTIRYWSVDQQNFQIPSLESYYLWNRLLWLGVGAVAFALSVLTFTRKGRKAKKVRARKLTVPEVIKPVAVPAAKITLFKVGAIPWWPLFTRQLRFEFQQTVKSIYFLVILLAGTGYMFITGSQVGKMFGTKMYPVTYNVLEFIGGTFSLFMLVIIILYVGEAVWRDRDLRIDQVIDALPVSNAILFAAKYVNLIVITSLMLAMVMVSGMIVQIAHGYTHFEIGQYLTHLYAIELPSYLNLISLAFFFQIVFRNKYLAHGLVIAYYLAYTFAAGMGFEHYLYNFNASPTPRYSDMNAYGSLMGIYHLYNSYWLLLSMVMVIASYVYWHRGTGIASFKQATQTALSRWTPSLKAATAVALVGFVALGSYLFYQSNVVNEYITSKEKERRAYDYEKKYKVFEKMPQPEFTSVVANVDIFPEDLKFNAKLKIKLQNKTTSPIEKMFINLGDDNWTFAFSRPTVMEQDDDLDVVIYTFATPLLPGEEFEADFTVKVDKTSIVNGSNVHNVRENGTFFNNFEFFPIVGYSSGFEIADAKSREKYGLAAKNRRAKIDDAHEYQFNYLGRGASWMEFEATVSTTPDQIAIAPGYLQKEWIQDGRRYFHYKMDQKILNFYAFLSGRYEVKRDQHNGVNIEIYYHKGHEYDLDRMINATKKGLDYFTKNYGPYQHKQYRIIEFPRFSTFAQAFPNTIPFSEGIGFIARVDDKNEDDIDFPFYITAHELAHQWWAHQLIGANVQGSEMMSESFSQYSALMIMEHEFGREKMKKFLKYELDRYLFGRGQEKEYENPIALTENQNYIHYNKGSVVFYALKEYLGEDVVNGAIRETLNKYGTRQSPYPTTREFVKVLKAKAKSAQIPLIEDMLEKIVLFENHPTKAVAKKVNEGTYEVEVDVSSKKVYSDKDGKEEVKDFAQEMEIGVLDRDQKYIYLEKHMIKSGDTKVVVQVKGEPYKAGVDPRNVLIDRNSNDNLTTVSFASSNAAATAEAPSGTSAPEKKEL